MEANEAPAQEQDSGDEYYQGVKIEKLPCISKPLPSKYGTLTCRDGGYYRLDDFRPGKRRAAKIHRIVRTLSDS